MKKSILSAALLLSLNCAFAQTVLPDFSKYPITNSKQATDANQNALQTAEYLLTNPIDKNKVDRATAAGYLMRWMEESPDFTFSFDAHFGPVSKEVEVSAIYIASMAKYQIENKKKLLTADESAQVWENFAKYMANPANNVQPKGTVKKLVDAYKEGKLKEYLAKQ
ncbi:hypothetical protein ACLI09_09385 [Flavobacterium sp. RHBU_24]|uniref:hypothetical protein n=1 Tax=Flavobacterium sp. RHBU_24 TaxID=3391185 RepID=UPI0039846A36